MPFQRSKSLIAALAIAVTAACESPCGSPMADIAPEINATLSPPDVRIGPGDSIAVLFSNKTDWNHTAVVRPDGVASFLSVDAVEVAGLLPEELDDQLSEAYSQVLPNSDLTVEVTPVQRTVAMLGEVTLAGELELPADRPLTVVDALARAGGFDRRTAFLGNLMLVRWIPEVREQRTWIIDARPEQWGIGDPIYLQPYDVVYVPNKVIDRFNIWIDQYLRLNIPFPYLIRPD